VSSTDRRTVRDLRALRRARRLGDTEWFDIAYRVYLFAFGGLIAVVVLSDAVGEVVDDDVTTDQVLAKGPAVLGLVVMAAIAIGLRGGSEGGPVALEAADVRHLLMSPVDRRMALLRPVAQRMRSVAFGLALGAGVIGQLVARELEGSRGSWAAAGALYGATVGALYVAAAMIAHAARLPRWVATAIGVAGFGWQAAAAWSVLADDGRRDAITGPLDAVGGIGMWGIRSEPSEIVALLVVALVSLAAVELGGGLRIERLARRADLVSQLKFAATIQDLRTVVLLRRQLRSEVLRTRPWGARQPRPVPSVAATPSAARPTRDPATATPGSLVHRRGFASLRRLPGARLWRIVLLAALAGILASLTVTNSPLFVVGVVGVTFLLGLECVEPLSQEIDRPSLTDGVPLDRGWIYSHHLVASGALVAAASIAGAAAATAIEPAHAAGAFALAVPVALAGAIGAVVATVRDAPQPAIVRETTLIGQSRNADSPLVPPEFAGMKSAYGSFMPVVMSGVAAIPVLAMRAEPTAGTAVRTSIAVTLALILLVVWVQRRDRWSIGLRRFVEEGRRQTKAAT